ncbi:hypothetical protein NPS53_09685 [Pseudomonas putida]|uniref:hypothetical protein n=1 Tax=Pseudomonas putida TaxID=303 RepID=UPI0023633528|nr:hypothetical protein [Pseudomonas putida]MDD2139849.1 hypothetical protein [Pseudomonas putida]HDS1721772.1 hypothetical protein [Pseudomonas putida]
MNLTAITKCNDCGSTQLTWHASIVNRSQVQQGRLNTHDMDCDFYLGCDNCSETLGVVGADAIAQHLTAQLRLNEVGTTGATLSLKSDANAP